MKIWVNYQIQQEKNNCLAILTKRPKKPKKRPFSHTTEGRNCGSNKEKTRIPRGGIRVVELS
jgi:hypothetical protein